MKRLSTIIISVIIALITLNILLRCNILQKKSAKCHLINIKTIFTDISTRGGKDPIFTHHVLVEGFSKKCKLDSVEILQFVNQYIDTISIQTKPVIRIYLYTSTDRFIPSETSQDWEDVDKDCLVSIMFDKKTHEPVSFKFYDKNGNIESQGNRWKRYE
jgi:hypothetical protein